MMIPVVGLILALWVMSISGDFADDNCLSNGSGSANVTASDGVVLPVYFKCKRGYPKSILGCALASAKERLINRFEVGAVKTDDGDIYMLSCFSTSEPWLGAGITAFCKDELKAGFDNSASGTKPSQSDKAIKKAVTADVPLDKDNKITVVYSVACTSNTASVEKCTVPSGSRFKNSTEISPGSTDTIVKDGVDWEMTCNKYASAKTVTTPQNFASRLCVDVVAAAWKKVVQQAIYPTPEEIKATKQKNVDVQVSKTNDKVSVLATLNCLSNPKPRLLSCAYEKGNRIKDGSVTVQPGKVAYILHTGTEYELSCGKKGSPSIDDKDVTDADKLCEDTIKSKAKERESKNKSYKVDDVISKTVLIDRPTSAKKLGAPVELTIACFGAYPKIKTCQHRFKKDKEQTKVIDAGKEGPCVDIGFFSTIMTQLSCHGLAMPEFMSPEISDCKA